MVVFWKPYLIFHTLLFTQKRKKTEKKSRKIERKKTEKVGIHSDVWPLAWKGFQLRLKQTCELMILCDERSMFAGRPKKDGLSSSGREFMIST